ncbi:MAG: carotenoid 1,2-hydratase [Thermodesulfovibrio sp.]|nr:carotenoid 1,2-hydratase [Thermodesulfovibrio sp.]
MKARLKCVVLLSVLLCVGICPGAAVEEFREVTPDRVLKFPADFYFRPDYRLQWWYFTGHLSDKDGNEFGYELTFFIAGVQRREFQSAFGVRDIYVSHFALTDVSGKKYYYSDRSDSGAFGFAGADQKRLRVWVGRNLMEGTAEQIRLTASGEGREINLVLRPVKPLVLHGDKGYSRKAEDAPLSASWYFSYTRMETEGTLKTGDLVRSVSGTSWFDREMSAGRMGRGQKGWDWFALQLDDGREIMLYVMRKAGGTSDRYSSGTFVNRDGSSRHLSSGDFSITVLRYYTSEKTGARYPARWEVRIPSEGIVLKVTPLVREQEFVATHSTGNHYWEGACSVANSDGTAGGRAYVEMTGY